ncbi:MAG TPA: cytochrome c peroxidase [Planctomycetota bacterium]|nr:cytochrome c peroxidase [Planctomycetota bacterium]
MKCSRHGLAWAALAGLLGIAWQAQGPEAGEDPPGPLGFDERELARILTLSPLGHPPPDPTNAWADDPRAAQLGQRLFFDTRLSRNGQIACATCHDPSRSFADGKPLSEGLGTAARHAPSLWNVAWQRWLFWDGRADSLWAQALGPIEDDVEMGSSRLAVAHVVHRDPALRAEYEALFGPLPALGDAARFPPDAKPVPDSPDDPRDRAWRAMRPEDREAVERLCANLGKSLAAYERRLVSRRSPFDVFVEGLRTGDGAKLAALSPQARRGLGLFIGKGSCRLCHGGPNLSDGEFHSIGLPPRGGGTPTDSGRHGGAERVLEDPFNGAGRYSDSPVGEAREKLETLARGPRFWGEFRTPSLRNVARTAPYMHQGQLASLRDVLRYYSSLEGSLPPDHHRETILRPRNFSEQEMVDLEAFLEALTDESIDPALLAPPPAAATPSSVAR